MFLKINIVFNTSSLAYKFSTSLSKSAKYIDFLNDYDIFIFAILIHKLIFLI